MYFKRIIFSIIVVLSILLSVPFLSSQYTQEMKQKDQRIIELEKQLYTQTKQNEYHKSILDSYRNGFKLKAIDSTIKKGKVLEIFRIYKNDIMIESNYNIDTVIVNKLYSAAQRIGTEPWISCYYAYLENRYSPYDLKLLKRGKKRVVVSNKEAYNLMQMTKIAFRDANNYIHSINGQKLNWYDVKYNLDSNIESSTYYIKHRIMPLYEEFKDHPQVGEITFWYYNGGPDYYANKLIAHKINN